MRYNNPPKPHERRIIASPEDFTPLSSETKVIGAFNPGVTTIETEKGLETILMIRIAEMPKEKTNGTIHLPFFEIENNDSPNLQISFDKVFKKDLLDEGKKEVRLKDKIIRLKHISLPRIMKLDKNGKIIHKDQKPNIYPCYEYERFGKEDFRIAHMGEEEGYILTSVSPHREFGVSTEMMITKDFKKFERLPKGNTPRPIFTGIKDVIVLPKKVSCTFEKEKMMYAALTRPNAYSDISTPGIWLTYSHDLIHWGNNHRLTNTQNGNITGTGPSLIELKEKNLWFGAFHEIDVSNPEKISYHTKLISLDRNHPWKVRHVSPILMERKDYSDILPEKGYVPKVVYTTGMTESEGTTRLYSGIDDTWTVMDGFYTEDLVKYAKN